MAIAETVIETWNYWNYYKRVLRNISTGGEYTLDTGPYSPSITGLLRVGVRIAESSSTEEVREYYVLVLRPDKKRLANQDFPIDVKLELDISTCVLSEGQSIVTLRVKPWANPNGLRWITSSLISYEQIIEHYIPFDISAVDYAIATYEETKTVSPTTGSVEFISLEQSFWKFMRDKTIGFAISGTEGYCEIFGPTYVATSVRPKFTIDQSQAARVQGYAKLTTEIKAQSRVKGVCKDREGDLITGVQCRIIVFNPDDYRIVGTGVSTAADGSFLIDVDFRVGSSVVVSFVETGQSIYGSEIMTTVSRSTV